MKYNEKIVEIPACPPVSAQEKDLIAYRISHNPTKDCNFRPQALNNPDRYEDLKRDREKCSNWALSCYSSLENIRLAAMFLNKSSRKYIGDHIAKIEIKKNDGLCTEPNIKGHFDFFEFSNGQYADGHEIVESLND